MKKIFVISAQQLFAEKICKFLNESNYQCDISGTLEEGMLSLRKKKYNIVFCDVPLLSHNDAYYILDQLKSQNPHTHIIFITEKLSLQEAIDLVKEGAYTCVNRPIHREELLSIIEEIKIDKVNSQEVIDELDKMQLPKVSKSALHTSSTPKYVEGNSNVSRVLYKQIDIVRDTALNVIIYGETGTGKESVARRLAGKSEHFPGQFIAIDCGCLSKDLAASELFGHEKGAFTGALNARAGAFEIAKDGTLFLDEIGNLDYQVQTYLLRAIQERKIRRIGGEKEINTNVRILAACNEQLHEMVKKGEFREDLYHRLNEFEINIPSLKERQDDIPLFVDFFLQRSASEFNKKVTGCNDEAMQALQQYTWPGNIRELKNTIRKICLLLDDNATHITLKDLPALLQNPIYNQDIIMGDMDIAEGELLTTENSNLNLKEQVLQTELTEIMKVLKSVNYNKTKAASILQINRKTLYNKLKMYEKLVAAE